MKKLGLSAIILVSLACISFGQTPTTAKEWYELGYKQFSNLEAGKAVQSFAECIRLNAKATPCYHYRALANGSLARGGFPLSDEEGGWIITDTEKLLLSIRDLDWLIQNDPNNTQFLSLRGASHFWLRKLAGRTDLALADFNKIIQIKPDDANTYINRAKLNLFKNDLEAVISDTSKAIQLNPKSSVAFEIRAAANCRKGDVELANRDEEKERELASSPKKVCYARGKTFSDEDWRRIKLSNKIEVLSELAAKYPDSYSVYLQRGKIQFEQKNLAEAKKDIQRALELNPSNAEAKEVLSKINALQPKAVDPKRSNSQKLADKAETILNDGASLLENGKVTDAEIKLKAAFAEITKAIEADETYSKPNQLLGFYYFVNSMSPNDKNPSLTRGLAIVAFNKAISLDPKNAAAVAGLGVVFEVSGKRAEAKIQYQKALQINPNEFAAKEGLKRVGN